MPSGSYIAVDDYAKMSDLVDHLKHLMNDTTAYMSYFDWMQEYELNGDIGRVFFGILKNFNFKGLWFMRSLPQGTHRQQCANT